MNFVLFDLEGFLEKKKEINTLGKPDLKKAYANGLKDQVHLQKYKGYTHYEKLLRNYFQLKVNSNRLEFEDGILKQTNEQSKFEVIKRASDKEIEIYEEYLSYVQEYKRGLSRDEPTTLASYGKISKAREVKTELIFCFDASFGMYHLSFFQTISKFIDLLNAVELEQTDVAIISYGYGTTMVSKFSASKAKLLFKTALMLPASGISLIYDNYKLSLVSDNDLDFALNKARALFFSSLNAAKKINRQVVVLSDGNLSGVVGPDSKVYDIDKKLRKDEALKRVISQKNALLESGVKISSISLKDGSNVIEELSKILFWEESVVKLNLGNNALEKEEKIKNKSLVDLEAHKEKLLGVMKLNLYYTQQEKLRKDTNVFMV